MPGLGSIWLYVVIPFTYERQRERIESKLKKNGTVGIFKMYVCIRYNREEKLKENAIQRVNVLTCFTRSQGSSTKRIDGINETILIITHRVSW